MYFPEFLSIDNLLHSDCIEIMQSKHYSSHQSLSANKRDKNIALKS